MRVRPHLTWHDAAAWALRYSLILCVPPASCLLAPDGGSNICSPRYTHVSTCWFSCCHCREGLPRTLIFPGYPASGAPLRFLFPRALPYWAPAQSSTSLLHGASLEYSIGVWFRAEGSKTIFAPPGALKSLSSGTGVVLGLMFSHPS